MGDLTIWQAAPEDSKAILGIYSFYIESSAASFETEVPPLPAFRERVERIAGEYPYLVCERESELVGYAYASKHRERAAYRYNVDVSVYIKNGLRARGIGSALYTRLLDRLAELEYFNAYAVITLPNEPSVALHRKLGFREVGIFHKTGYKLGRWHDVLWMERALRDHGSL